MIKTINKYKKVYVACPGNVTTGGPDALHQITYYFNKIGIKATIAYCSKEQEISIPESYKVYVNDFIRFEEIEDSVENAIIYPEIYCNKYNVYKKCHVYIWWLGLENGKKFLLPHVLAYTAKFPIRLVTIFKFNLIKGIKELKKRWNRVFNLNSNVTYLCASKYAYDYISKLTKREVHLCIEPISKYFLESYSKTKINTSSNRKDVVLYNPAKCGEYVSKLIKNNEDINFVPLKGFSQDQLIEQYNNAKLYIDFGAFSGAERMPKEAVLFGCSILTGLHGASFNDEDVKIPRKYKIDETKLSYKEVGNIIKNMLSNYESINDDFNDYRNKVLNLEDNFIKSLKDIFTC